MKEISRELAIKALDSMWDVAFPEGSQERLQFWAEERHLCDEWDPEDEGTQEDARPPGVWDLLLAIGVTRQELIDYCNANPKIF
jgi:hypothetical protein